MSENSSVTTTTTTNETDPPNTELDEDLNALLDSALNDFDDCDSLQSARIHQQKHPPVNSDDDDTKTVTTTDDNNRTAKPWEPTTNNSDTNAGNDDSAQLCFDDNFDDSVRTDFEKFDEMFSPLLNADPELKEHWNKLTKSCAEAANATSDEEFQASLHETLKTISDKAKTVAGDESQLSDEDLAKIWSNLGIEDQSEPNGAAFSNLMPIMTNMMQNLLSKELLYPALSELAEKYPSWLSENKDKLSAEELKQYTKQMELMKQVCDEFDTEKPDDSETIKKERFQRVLTFMQQMQACGSPPQQLIGDVPDFAGIPADGQLPEMMAGQQCCVM